VLAVEEIPSVEGAEEFASELTEQTEEREIVVDLSKHEAAVQNIVQVCLQDMLCSCLKPQVMGIND